MIAHGPDAMKSSQRGYLQSFETDASAGVLWRALVDPRALPLWFGQAVNIDARPGGVYVVDWKLMGRRSALIDLCEPQRRLRLIFDANPEWPAPGEHVLVEDFIIDTRGDRRLMRMLGSGVPGDPEWNPILKRLRSGWAVAFSYLQKRLESGDLERRGP